MKQFCAFPSPISYQNYMKCVFVYVFAPLQVCGFSASAGLHGRSLWKSLQRSQFRPSVLCLHTQRPWIWPKTMHQNDKKLFSVMILQTVPALFLILSQNSCGGGYRSLDCSKNDFSLTMPLSRASTPGTGAHSEACP